jgi:hypothetical protein
VSTLINSPLNASKNHVRVAAAIVGKNFANKRAFYASRNSDPCAVDITSKNRSRAMTPVALTIAVA